MKDENELIADDEYVIRAIWKGFYDATLPVPITPSAFQPRSDETDGISVFRAACVADPEDILVVFAEEKRDSYALALLAVTELTSLGLNLQPARIDSVCGHMVIPELNVGACKANKAKYRDIFTRLATCANARLLRPPKAEKRG